MDKTVLVNRNGILTFRSVSECARELGVSPSTLRRMCDNGQRACFKEDFAVLINPEACMITAALDKFREVIFSKRFS